VGGALVSQHVFDMQPCPWCVLQRLIFVAIALVCLVGAAIPVLAGRVGAAALAGCSRCAASPRRCGSTSRRPRQRRAT
jgi:disulfide bond formation protein DsbB